MAEAGDMKRPMHVLVVEDEADTARTLAQLLKLQGYSVAIASDGQGALQAAEAAPPDVILLDIGLPKLNGYEVAKRLRETDAPKKPLLIAVTGFGQDSQRLHSYEVGIDLHLTKPVSFEELQRFLEQYQANTGPAK
jgi:DNA-binding response OmpR family regulator